MLQSASADTVVAPFSGAPVVLRGAPFVPGRDGERFTIRVAVNPNQPSGIPVQV
jgi:hypothetical protein